MGKTRDRVKDREQRQMQHQRNPPRSQAMSRRRATLVTLHPSHPTPKLSQQECLKEKEQEAKEGTALQRQPGMEEEEQKDQMERETREMAMEMVESRTKELIRNPPK